MVVLPNGLALRELCPKFRLRPLFSLVVFAWAIAVPLSAVASTATIESLGRGRSVSGLNNGSPASYNFAGTFNLRIDDAPSTVPGYCIDINTGIAVGDTIPQVPSDYPVEVLYILNNAYPHPNGIGTRLTDTDCEAAAVQCAIWFFTDNMVCQGPSAPDCNVAGRADQIADAASAAAPMTLTAVPQSLAIEPATATLFANGGATSHSVAATLRDGDGNPMSGFTIELALTSGPNASEYRSGPSPTLSLQYVNTTAASGTDEFVAAVSYTIPRGQKFKAANKQAIVLAGAPQTGTLTAEAEAIWTQDVCGNGVVGPGEQCDDGNDDDHDGCTSACEHARCGDGIAGPGEECDDGNQIDGDGCDAGCAVEPCPITITTIDSPDAVEAGSLLGYSVTIRNGGSLPADGLFVRIRLDEDVEYVLDDGACVRDSSGRELTCVLGPLDAQATATISVSVRVQDDAPTGGTDNGALCGSGADVCVRVEAGCAAIEQATDVIPPIGPGPGPGICGDGIVDAGEECDAPGTEDCANLFDDDGDGLADCTDPDCLTGLPTCSLDCQVIRSCQDFERDPAILRFGGEGELDTLMIHARFNPLTPVDLYTESVGFLLSNANGVIFRGEIYPGDLSANSLGTVFRFDDRSAKTGNGRRSGIAKLKIRERLFQGMLSFPFRITALGDFSQATLPRMTTEIYFGDDVAAMTADWRGRYGRRWVLRVRDFNAQQ